MNDILQLNGYDLTLKANDREYKVISGADLEIQKGEIVGLIGESGCGKSMLWKSMLGLADPNRWIVSGEAVLNGVKLDIKDKDSMSEIRGNQAAVILQDPMSSFDQVFTIEYHFIETAKAHKQWSDKEIHDKAVALLKRLFIREPEKVLKMYPFQCSGGMLQRIMIAIAMMMDAPLIIADEPTTAVDVTIQREITAMLKEVNRERGTSILFISHDLKIIEDIADRIYVMYAGSMVESFPAEKLRTAQVCHPYTVKLLQARPSFTRDYLPTLEGNLPTLSERREGCPFAPRCGFAEEKCRAYDMERYSAGDKHMVRCWKYKNIYETDRS